MNSKGWSGSFFIQLGYDVLRDQLVAESDGSLAVLRPDFTVSKNGDLRFVFPPVFRRVLGSSYPELNVVVLMKHFDKLSGAPSCKGVPVRMSALAGWVRASAQNALVSSFRAQCGRCPALSQTVAAEEPC